MDKQSILRKLNLNSLPDLSEQDFEPASAAEKEQITTMAEAVSYRVPVDICHYRALSQPLHLFSADQGR